MSSQSPLARSVLMAILRKLPVGSFAVRHLDGTIDRIGRDDPVFTIVVKHPHAYQRLVLGNPSLTIGEAYTEGEIDIEGSIERLVGLGTDLRNAIPGSSVTRLVSAPREAVKSRQKQNIAHHYDIGNDFFRLWLDESMTYSCGFFEHETDTLEAAQYNKRALVHRKLHLQPGQHVLEIGSGWGTALIQAVEEYDVTGVGLTLSEEQLKHATAEAARRGLSDRVEFRLQNYQDIEGEQFDAIYSIGMYEHVGRRQGPKYFAAVRRLLKDGGISVLHTVAKQGTEGGQPWINKYIFPGAYVPAAHELVANLVQEEFRLVHMENLRLHYAMTLDEWYRRFEAARPEIEKRFDERFLRMWTFYLRGCAGSFRYGAQDLMQVVFTKGRDADLPLTNAYMYEPQKEVVLV